MMKSVEKEEAKKVAAEPAVEQAPAEVETAEQA